MSGAGDRTLSYPTGDSSAETPFPGAYIVVAFDCEQPRTQALRLSLSEVDEVRIGRGDVRLSERLSEAGVPVLALKLADKHMSSNHARIKRDSSSPQASYTLSDDGSKNGTFLNGSAISSASMLDGDLIEVGSTLILFRDNVERYAREPADVDAASFADNFATLSPPFSRHLSAAARVAATDLPILITGASGAGKEVAARWLHARSGRSGEFVAINCGALPENLVEAELFGAKRGAFSGADRDRPGLIRAAAGGTLFLDEVGELPLAAQVKLLRVLQEKEVVAVGDTTVVKVDVRFVAATLQDVDAAVQEGRFRHDLLARLAGFRMLLPELGERREDIGSLAARLLDRVAPGDDSVRFERDAGRALMSHDWPLNVRELEQVLHSAVALAGGKRIGLAHLPEAVADAAEPGRRVSVPDGGSEEEALRREIEVQLRRHKGNVSAVAREMGRARVQVRRWCVRFDIDIASFR